jgi:hypothetical protein
MQEIEKRVGQRVMIRGSANTVRKLGKSENRNRCKSTYQNGFILSWWNMK